MLQFETREELTAYLQEQLINTSEAVDFLECSRQYIEKLVKKGKLTPVKESPRDRIYWRSDVERFKKSKGVVE